MVLDAIDMDSYRVEVESSLKIVSPHGSSEIEPIITRTDARKSEPELDHLSNILKNFNDLFGSTEMFKGGFIHSNILLFARFITNN